MDLSQQELPLTTYFTKATAQSQSRLVSREGDGVSRSKRKRNDARCSPASPPRDSVRQSRLRPTTLQLPTPAASARKRLRSGDHKGLSDKGQLTSPRALSFVKHGMIPSKDAAQPEFAPTTSRSPRSSRQSTDDTAPESHNTSILVRKETEPIDLELLSHPRVGIMTPQTSSRRAPEHVHRIDDSPLSHSNRPLPSEPKNSASVAWDRTLAPSKTTDRQHVVPVAPVQSSQSQYLLHPDATPKRKRYLQSKGHLLSPSNGHVLAMAAIQSSQSQYLLHPDATPKRKRCFQPIDHAISSQTREGSELTLSSGKHPRGSARTPRSCNKRKSLCTRPHGSSSVAPVSAPTGPSRFSSEKKTADESPFVSFSSSRQKASPFHSPSRKNRTHRGLSRHDSIENVPPARIEDSVTEPESDLDIFQVPRRSPVSQDKFLPTRSAQRDFASAVDDSATEAESDTEILHCVAEIGRKRPCERRPAASREDTPSPLIVSPLVSPARSRVAAKRPIIDSTRLPAAQGTSSRSYAPSAVEQPRTCSESLPSVVREFIRMFPGDESYPPDFPESLRM